MNKLNKTERKSLKDYAADNTARTLRDIAAYKKRDKLTGLSLRSINRKMTKEQTKREKQ